MRLRLMQRHPCELCEAMHYGLATHSLAHRVDVELVDVDQDPVLKRRYGLRVPVVVDDWGEVICEARFDARALEEALQAFAAQGSKAG